MQHIDVGRVWSAGKGSLRKAASFRELLRGGDNRSEHSGKYVIGDAVYVPAGRILRVDEVDINVRTANSSTIDVERQTPPPSSQSFPRKMRTLGFAASWSGLSPEPTKLWTQLRQG